VTDESIFAAALAIADPAERSAYLDRACAGNADLRREVEGLLKAHAASNPLDQPPRPFEGTGPYVPENPNADSAAELAVGDRIGSYKLLERIGEGGMGEVWVADQIEPIKRRVALKVIKPGMDSRSVLARFEAERQALALMDHPNIARVFDAGTTPDGQPFFVMELVKGTPITEFCDARTLTPQQRLELFIPVCQAIQHAHMKGIIHRDIKPSNVLVELHDDKPVAKVIDFGVAKAIGQQLTEKTIYTGFGALVGTPAYMAPEQARFNALDVDTRADVYALGVLLYELLAGSPPLEPQRLKRAALDEVLRIVREEEPPRPSTRLSSSETRASIAATRQSDPARLSALLKGELDWIVMRALEKDRSRRYDTPSGLARDVQRYLSGEAVEACPPTLGYRLSKFYRRNRAVVQVVAAFVGLLTVAAAVSAALAWRANEAEKATGVERDRAIEAEKERGLERDRAIEAEKATGVERDRAIEAEGKTSEALKKVRLAVEEQQASQYLSDMLFVPVAFRSGASGEARRLLDRHVPGPGQTDRRALEWYFWDRLFSPRTSGVLENWTSQVDEQVGAWHALSLDGTRVAQISEPLRLLPGPGTVNAELTVWDVRTHRALLKHKIPMTRPLTLFHPPAGPRLLRPLICLSADGKRVAFAGLLTWPSNDIRLLMNLCLGTSAVIPADKDKDPPPESIVYVVDVDTGKVILDDRSQAAWSCWFSPDARWLKLYRPIRPTLRVLDLTKEHGPTTLDLDKREMTAFLDYNDPWPMSPGGSEIFLFRSGRITVRDLATGKERGWDLAGVRECRLALSPAGRLLAGVATDGSGSRTLRLWEAATGKELHNAPLGISRQGRTWEHVSFSPNGARLKVALRALEVPDQPTDVSVWDPYSGNHLPAPVGLTSNGVFSPDGKWLLDPGNPLKTWETATANPGAAFLGHTESVRFGAFMPDGKTCVSITRSGQVREWDLGSQGPAGLPLGPEKYTAPLLAGAISEDGLRLAALVAPNGRKPGANPEEDVVQVWDAAGKPIHRLPNRLPTLRRSNVDTGGIRLPEVLEPSLRPAPAKADDASKEKPCEVEKLSLDRERRRAVMLSSPPLLPNWRPIRPLRPMDVTVWDVERGTLLRRKYFAVVDKVLMAPDGSRVAILPTPPSTWANGIGPDLPHEIRLLDAEGSAKPKVLPLPDGLPPTPPPCVRAVAFSPDGRKLAARIFVDVKPNPVRRLVVWDLDREGPPATFNSAEPEWKASQYEGNGLFWSADGAWLINVVNRVQGDYVRVQDAVSISILDASTGATLVTMEQPLGGVGQLGVVVAKLALSPDRRRLAALMTQPPWQVRGELRAWDIPSGKLVLTEPLELLGNNYDLGRWGGTIGNQFAAFSFTADGLAVTLRELGVLTDDPNVPNPRDVRGTLMWSVRTLGATAEGQAP
jgi:serine/threonine protein kinase/WD40 repeat protein